MNNDDISHFSTIHASFAIKSNVYFIAHQYLIINNSQSQRALSVSVRTVLWIYFASRRNCGLLPHTFQHVYDCTGVKKSLVLEPGTSKISVRTSKYFHPMSKGQVKDYSIRLYLLECPALFCNRTSTNLGVLVCRTSEHFKIFLPLLWGRYMYDHTMSVIHV